MYFTRYFIAVGLKLVLVWVSIRLIITERLMRHQKWEMFHNLVNLTVKLWFMNYTRRTEYVKGILKRNCVNHLKSSRWCGNINQKS